MTATEQSTDTVVARYVYDAFGQREQTVSAVLQDYGFTGREFDPESGLYYYRARHYDPGAGAVHPIRPSWLRGGGFEPLRLYVERPRELERPERVERVGRKRWQLRPSGRLGGECRHDGSRCGLSCGDDQRGA